MTISSTTVKVSYSGNGSTTVFAYTFKILDDDEIQVIIRSSTGTETVKTKTTHYTVSGVGSSGGGNITFLTAPTATQTVVLRRLTTQTQETDYVANDPFPADSHEEALDRVTMVAQEIQEELGRAIKLSKTNTMTSTEFTVAAADRANKILAFDTNGEISVTQELGTYKGNWTTATAYYGRDIIKDTSNNNIYIANTAHTSSGSQPISTNADVAKWDLLVDAASASTSANSAANHASNSSNFANNSSNSANTSANHSANSSNFANNASNHATNASTYSAGVAANASNASNFANNSSNSANSASNHSSNSSNFANNSSNSANTSSNHASNSSNHASNASNSANSASTSATTATTQAGYASSNAATATTQAGYATSNATAALGYSSNSSNFSNNASNFANTASNAANAANAARDTAISLVDNFEDVYLGSKTTDPTLDNDGDALTAGDLYYNSVGNVLKYYTGSAWVSITSGGITDLVQDTTPQLGGSLDVNGNSIISTSNGNIVILPNGTGKVSLDGIFYPTADGTAGQAIVTNGSGTLSFATAGIAWQAVVTAATLSAVSGRGYFINTTSNACTVTLPASPTIGDTIAIVDYAGTSATNKITLNGNGNKIDGSSINKTIQTNEQAIIITYSDATRGWVLTSASLEGTLGLVGVPASPTIGTATATSGTTATVVFTAPSDNGGSTITSYTATSSPGGITGTLSQSGSGTITVSGLTTSTSYTFTVTATNTIGTSSPSSASNSITTPSTYSVDFLVIAGGGAGGRLQSGGGGGAGGYRSSNATYGGSGGGASAESSLTFTAGTVYTITVGAGGASATSNGQTGPIGSDSVISGSGITTITSLGGGGGGAGTQTSGGSGGGSADTTPPGNIGASGTANQGYAGGNGNGGGAGWGGGGGGGAGAVGANATGTNAGTAGNGGAGKASTITGSSITRAGGGGASHYNGTRGLGSNGGGDGDAPWGDGTNNSTAGSANTGGGGGSSNNDGNSGAGGSGVVIIRMLTSKYSGTTTGSPTVTTSGSDTILRYTASGSYTA